MARKKSLHLTGAELRLMEVLWEKVTATVSDVVRILENKGRVRHTKEGRALVYHPVAGRGQARQSAVTYLLRRFFENSRELLMLNLIEGKRSMQTGWRGCESESRRRKDEAGRADGESGGSHKQRDAERLGRRDGGDPSGDVSADSHRLKLAAFYIRAAGC